MSAPRSLLLDILPRLAGLVALMAVGAAVIYAIRRWTARGPAAPREGFTLQQLRDLRAAGALTEEEYERAKAAIIGRLSGGDSPATRGGDAARPSDPRRDGPPQAKT